jgi:hypothetical protein
MFLMSTRSDVLRSGNDPSMTVRMAAVAQFLFSFGRQALCALRGHEMMLHFGPNRLSLQCLACGAETPGWRLDVSRNLPRPQVRVAMRAPKRPQKAGPRSLLTNQHDPAPASPVRKAA